jgi:hypothetical protein
MIEATHERLSAAEKVVAGSDRSFGVVMAVACSIIALINLWQGGWLWAWIGAPAIFFLLTAILRPTLLNPLNRAWLAFGLLLHQVLNPIVLALLFFGAVLPTGLVMRALGKDLLRLRLKPETDSYWIVRQPPGPAPESMVDQF